MATRERSPNYPSEPLSRAIELVKRLYAAEKRTSVPTESAVKAWGHDSVSGPARTRLAALRQYGLVEVLPGNNVRVSNLGLTFCLVPPGDHEYQEALRTAALNPPLLKQLWTTMRDASEHTLKTYLVRDRQFSDDGADRVVRFFKANVSFANLSAESYAGEAHDDSTDSEMITDVLEQRHRPSPDPSTSQQRVAPPSTGYRYPLPGGTVAELKFAGAPVTAKGLRMLKKYVEMLELALADQDPDSADAPPATPVRFPASQMGARPGGLTDDARNLIEKVDAGGVPSFTTANLQRIARENGVEVSEGMTPNEIVDELRQKAV